MIDKKKFIEDIKRDLNITSFRNKGYSDFSVLDNPKVLEEMKESFAQPSENK